MASTAVITVLDATVLITSHPICNKKREKEREITIRLSSTLENPLKTLPLNVYSQYRLPAKYHKEAK